MNYENYPQQEVVSAKSAGLLGVRETIKQRLERQRAEVAQHLANLDQALKFIADNPGFEQFHDILARVGF